MRQHWWRGASLLFAGTILLAACSSGTSPSASAAGSSAVQPSASAATSSGTKELDDALAGKYRGTTITAFGPFVDEDQAKYETMVKVFFVVGVRSELADAYRDKLTSLLY